MDDLARRGEWGGLCRLDFGYLHALNASTGAQLWSYAIARRRDGPRPRWRMGWFISALDARPSVYALNASTGALLWTYSPATRHFSVFARRGEWGGLCRLRVTATCMR